MSFNVNIGSSGPVIKASAGTNNDGGSGGNLGYMMQERKKKKEQKSPISFKTIEGNDTFELVSQVENDVKQESNWFSGLITKIMG